MNDKLLEIICGNTLLTGSENKGKTTTLKQFEREINDRNLSSSYFKNSDVLNVDLKTLSELDYILISDPTFDLTQIITALDDVHFIVASSNSNINESVFDTVIRFTDKDMNAINAICIFQKTAFRVVSSLDSNGKKWCTKRLKYYFRFDDEIDHDGSEYDDEFVIVKNDE